MKGNTKIASIDEKADILLLYLEELKERVKRIENQYNFSSHNYTRVCEDAILKINHIKSDLEKDDNKPVKSDTGVYEKNNLEARFKLGLVTPETYYRYNNISKDKAPRRSKLQNAIDNTAGGIEFALDRIGDGMIYPFVIISDGYNLLKRRFRKSHRQQRTSG